MIKKGRYDAYISDVVIGEITESPKKKQKQLFPLIKKFIEPLIPKYNIYSFNPKLSISERKMTYLGMNIWYNHFVRVLSELG